MMTELQKRLVSELERQFGEKPGDFDRLFATAVLTGMVVCGVERAHPADLVVALAETARAYERQRVERERNRKLGRGVAALIPDGGGE